MSIRITPLKVLLLVTPLVLLAIGLSIHDAYWLPSGMKQRIPAHSILVMGAGCVAIFLGSFLPVVHDLLGQDFWYKLHLVRSSPGQANIAIFGMRWGTLAVLWCIAILTVAGRG